LGNGKKITSSIKKALFEKCKFSHSMTSRLTTLYRGYYIWVRIADPVTGERPAKVALYLGEYNKGMQELIEDAGLYVIIDKDATPADLDCLVAVPLPCGFASVHAVSRASIETISPRHAHLYLIRIAKFPTAWLRNMRTFALQVISPLIHLFYVDAPNAACAQRMLVLRNAAAILLKKWTDHQLPVEVFNKSVGNKIEKMEELAYLAMNRCSELRKQLLPLAEQVEVICRWVENVDKVLAATATCKKIALYDLRVLWEAVHNSELVTSDRYRGELAGMVKRNYFASIGEGEQETTRKQNAP
jgi:hypothetical protein